MIFAIGRVAVSDFDERILMKLNSPRRQLPRQQLTKFNCFSRTVAPTNERGFRQSYYTQIYTLTFQLRVSEHRNDDNAIYFSL